MKIVLIILAVLVFLLAVLLLSSIRLVVKFDSGGRSFYHVRYLFFGYRSEKPHKKRAKKREKEQESEQKESSFLKKMWEKHGADGTFRIIFDSLKAFFSRFPVLYRHLVVRRFSLTVKVAEGDAAVTALVYGGVCAAVYPLIALLQSKIKPNAKNIQITLDYGEKGTTAAAYTVCSVRMCFFLSAALYIFSKISKSTRESNAEVKENEKGNG